MVNISEIKLNWLKQPSLWVAFSLALISDAQALKLSPAVLHSKHGEALKADIDILSMTAAEQVNLRIGVASAEIYKATNIPIPRYQGAPLEIEVKLLQRDNHFPYLSIRSPQVMPDEEVHVLIDMRWATGGLLQDVQLSQNTTGALISSKSVTYPTYFTDSATSIRVRWGDNAHRLLDQHAPTSDVLRQQMLLALLRKNPHAFADSNVNRLKTGVLLTIPPLQEAKEISLLEATQEIRRQNKRFRAYQATLAASNPSRANSK